MFIFPIIIYTFQNSFTVFFVFFATFGCMGGSIGHGGGGGGMPPSSEEDASTSESSSECRVEKSKSHNWRERSHSLTNLSHCKSVSVFLDNISIAESEVGLFTTSFLDWDLASPANQKHILYLKCMYIVKFVNPIPSIAFDIIPLISSNGGPSLVSDSSGLRRLVNFCVKSFTELSLWTCESPLQDGRLIECNPFWPSELSPNELK